MDVKLNFEKLMFSHFTHFASINRAGLFYVLVSNKKIANKREHQLLKVEFDIHPILSQECQTQL